MKITSSLFFFILISSLAFGQMENYNYTREIQGINDSWHKITLPNSIFKNVKNDLSDIRIFGITSNKDTIVIFDPSGKKVFSGTRDSIVIWANKESPQEVLLETVFYDW